MGTQMAAMRERKSFAWAVVCVSEEGKGLMKIMRSLGCWWRWFRRRMLRGMLAWEVVV